MNYAVQILNGAGLAQGTMTPFVENLTRLLSEIGRSARAVGYG